MAILIHYYFDSIQGRHRYFGDEDEAIAVAGSRLRLTSYYGEEEVAKLRARLCAGIRPSLPELRPQRESELQELDAAIVVARAKESAREAFRQAAHKWHSINDRNLTSNDATLFEIARNEALRSGMTHGECGSISMAIRAQYVK